MKKWIIALLILLSFCYFMFLAYGCSLLIKVVPEKQPAAVIQPAAQPTATASKPKQKTRYEILKEEHNKEWLNLPHDPIDSRFFPTDSNYNNDGKNWERKTYN